MKESPDFRPVKEDKLQQLAEWREDKENSPYDFDVNFLYQLIFYADEPEEDALLKKKHLKHETGHQALVLTRDQLEQLEALEGGILRIVNPKGKVIRIFAEAIDPDDVLVIYPHELGDEIQEE
ncbi:hypothetical protein COU77_01750 [Candidatus Peregrinibacteria bacterium CG10_big_fil_rev_8_21_14_0_10_49_16]|nr:MAG: hypothetical protein COU77_01750 [Candidatus Peregrinibacteria bacterium CG10_big_fil_rev_8_21_14_0_10_49_16]